MADVTSDETESSLLLASNGEESHSDTDLKSESVSDIKSSELQEQGEIVEGKETEIELAGGGKLEEVVDDSSRCKFVWKPEESAGVKKAGIVTFSPEKPMGTNLGKEAKIAAEKSDIKPVDVVPKYDSKAASGESTLPKSGPVIPDGKTTCVDSETIRDKEGVPKKSPKASSIKAKESPKRVSTLSTDSSEDGKVAGCFSMLSPKARSSKAKESPKSISTLSADSSEDGKVAGCFSRLSPKARTSKSPKRVSTLSADSSEDGKEAGCFSRLSPKRFCDLFKTRSPKLKASPSLTAAFSPIGCGKHFEVVYLGQCFPGDYERVERIDYTNMAEEKIIPTFLGARPCYDVMPTSGKVVVFSVELLVKNAFSALVSNEIKAAPLWDAGIMDFVGMLTITDFINVLKYYYITKPEDMKDIENQSIATWRRMTGVPKKFVKINGQDSLALAAKLLIQERIHRIPVFDEKRQCVLFVLTKKRLLQFLSQGLLEKFDKTNVRTPTFFKKTIRELKIGTFEDIAVVNKDTKIIDALGIFVTRNVSALPVLNKDNILIDLFEKFDVFGLAKDQTYHNLEMTVDDVISKPYARETAWICTMDETLETVINKFVTRKVHRLVVIDARRGVTGMISLSDVLKFLIVQPLALMESATVSDTILEGSEGAVGGTEEDPDCPVEVDLATGVAHMKIGPSETTDDPQEEEEPSADE